jgi:hypothetical protein
MRPGAFAFAFAFLSVILEGDPLLASVRIAIHNPSELSSHLPKEDCHDSRGKARPSRTSGVGKGEKAGK